MSSAPFLAEVGAPGEHPARRLGPPAQLLDARPDATHWASVPLDRSVNSGAFLPGPSRDATKNYGSTTRSSRWTASCGKSSGRSDVRRPAAARSCCGAVATQSLCEDGALVVEDLDRRVGLEDSLDAAHARRQQRFAAAHQRPPGAGVDLDTTLGAFREGDPQLAAREALRTRRERRADGTTCEHASATTAGALADAMTARTPDHAAIFAAASLLAIPPLPRSEPVPPATRSTRRRPRRSPRSARRRRRAADRR